MTPLLAALFGFGLMHAARGEVHRFERLAATEIASLLSGDEKQVRLKSDVGPECIFGDVHRVEIHASRFSADGLPLFTEPWRSRKGILRDLQIDMQDFLLRGLPVQKLTADIPDCRFDMTLALRHHRFRLSKSGTGRGEVAVSAEGLAKFIRQKYPVVKRADVRMENGLLSIEGRIEMLVMVADFSVRARLVPTGGSQLTLTDAHVVLNGKDADPAWQEKVLQTLNPVVDLDRDLGLNGAMRVEWLKLSGGMLTAGGPASIPAKPGGTNPAIKAL